MRVLHLITAALVAVVDTKTFDASSRQYAGHKLGRSRPIDHDLLALPSQLQTETTAPDLAQMPATPPTFSYKPNTFPGLTALRQTSLHTLSGQPPVGTYEVLTAPGKVRLTMAASNVELICTAYGEFQGTIRWVRLKERHLNSQDFLLVADGSHVFDSSHYSVHTDGYRSRLTIRNLEPEKHYGTYQCHVQLPGNGNFIEKIDFIVGKEQGG